MREPFITRCKTRRVAVKAKFPYLFVVLSYGRGSGEYANLSLTLVNCFTGLLSLLSYNRLFRRGNWIRKTVFAFYGNSGDVASCGGLF